MAFSWFGDLNIEGDGGKDISGKITQADLDMSVEEVTELSFAVHDPNFEYLKGFFAGGPKIEKSTELPTEDGKQKQIKNVGPLGKSAVYQSGSLKMVCSAFELEGGPAGVGQTTFRMQPEGIERLRQITGEFTADDISPSDYVKQAGTEVGLTVVAQDTTSRPSIARDVPEEREGMTEDDKASAARQANEWTTLQRLASEEGFLIYEAFGSLYFGTPSWLLKTNLTHTVGIGGHAPDRDHRVIGLPTITMSQSRETHNEMTITLPRTIWRELQVGNGIVVQGAVALGDKPLVITNIRLSLAGPATTIEVVAREPWVIPKQTEYLEEEEATTSGGFKGQPGTKFKYDPSKPEGEQVVAAAMEYLGTTYAWGGGNITGPTKGISDGGGAADACGDYDKVGFDCSGLTLYAVYAGTNGRVQLPRISQNQAGFGQTVSMSNLQAGDLVFPTANSPGHVMIAMGDGNVIEAPQSCDVVKISPVRGSHAKRVI